MIRSSARVVALLLSLVVLFVAAGCRPSQPVDAPSEQEPIFEEESFTFLRSRLDQAVELLRAEEEPTAQHMAATAELERIRTYYVPLLEARAIARNARRYLSQEKPKRAAEAIDRVEKILTRIGEVHGGRLYAATEEPLQRIAAARGALDPGGDTPIRRAKAVEALDQLILRLGSMLSRGALILETLDSVDDEPESAPETG